MRTSVNHSVVDSIESLVGSTPLLRLRLDRLAADLCADGARASGCADVELLAKLESANPLSSVKDRAALYMLRSAEERGEIRPGGTVIEATSGNTGISLAAFAASRGYRCLIVLPEGATAERAALLGAFGAELVRTPREDGYPGALAKAEELHAAMPGSWFTRQHENRDNARAHYETTGPEIWEATGGRIDVLVCGVGTGGTLSGTAAYLKERDPAIRVVAVEPEKSPVLSQGTGGLHRIPGLNGGFVAPVTDVSLIDVVVTVSDEDAWRTARRLARGQGVLAGISAGAAVHACTQLAAKPEYAGTTMVTVLPDTGERYLSLWAPSDTEGRVTWQ
ncbi:PLP-dependent cysteine synthase family protein [Streptomyces luteolus]|uniref:Cysteine synthase family protein n=1 Tax=Streptomyces luteolus TaxID=3043615 RepID=A0ABT6T7B1_9ACTN|nr:cysteine synthase family protein [Streptomyces sp. B-S-A12]MDI3423776.1 cysteine synthase family protein [Streptomyces sp. B-S-A12]